jgi:hypothetical protein
MTNPDDLIRALSGTLSLRRRIAYVLLLLAGLSGAAFVGLLWITEPDLPPRTAMVFAALVVIGLAWAGYAAWALTRRTPLFALDRLIGGWLGVAATTLLTVATVVLTVVRNRVEPAAYAMAGTLLVVAVAHLVYAHSRRAALLRRKRELGG